MSISEMVANCAYFGLRLCATVLPTACRLAGHESLAVRLFELHNIALGVFRPTNVRGNRYLFTPRR
jgi:hypothetical protein